MTSHIGRLYALALALVVFFLAWAVVAARPWATTPTADPRLKALAVREAQLRREAKLVQPDRRRNGHSSPKPTRSAAAPPQATSPAAAGRAIVNLPPLTITRTS